MQLLDIHNTNTYIAYIKFTFAAAFAFFFALQLVFHMFHIS